MLVPTVEEHSDPQVHGSDAFAPVAREEWRPVLGFQGIYEVSSIGRVRSVDRIDPAGRRQSSKLRVLQVAKRGGYLVLNLRKERKIYSKKVHHLVASAFIGPPPLPLHSGIGPTDGFCDVNHKDGNKRNNVVNNLEYLTRSENITHSYTIGLHDGATRGERNGRAKLQPEQVREIRSLYASGNFSIPALAGRFDVGKSSIGYIVQGVTWAHLLPSQ